MSRSLDRSASPALSCFDTPLRLKESARQRIVKWVAKQAGDIDAKRHARLLVARAAADADATPAKRARDVTAALDLLDKNKTDAGLPSNVAIHEARALDAETGNVANANLKRSCMALLDLRVGGAKRQQKKRLIDRLFGCAALASLCVFVAHNRARRSTSTADKDDDDDDDVGDDGDDDDDDDDDRDDPDVQLVVEEIQSIMRGAGFEFNERSPKSPGTNATVGVLVAVGRLLGDSNEGMCDCGVS